MHRSPPSPLLSFATPTRRAALIFCSRFGKAPCTSPRCNTENLQESCQASLLMVAQTTVFEHTGRTGLHQKAKRWLPSYQEQCYSPLVPIKKLSVEDVVVLAPITVEHSARNKLQKLTRKLNQRLLILLILLQDGQRCLNLILQ